MAEEPVRLVIIDSLRSGMAGDENSSEFGEKLAPWAALARDIRAPIVIVHHARKSPDGTNIMRLDRLRGSSAITALPRVVLGIDRPDPYSENLRVHVLKNNFVKPPEPFGVELTEANCKPASVPREPRPDTREGEAEAWLEDVLSRGARPSSELKDEAKTEGITPGTLHRARKALGIRELRDPENSRRTLWGLPSEREGPR